MARVAVPPGTIDRIGRRARPVQFRHPAPHTAVHQHPVVPLPQLPEQFREVAAHGRRGSVGRGAGGQRLHVGHGGRLDRPRQRDVMSQHLRQPRRGLEAELRRHAGADHVPVVIGGTLPVEDISALESMGVKAVFPAGTLGPEIVSTIERVADGSGTASS